MFEAIYEMANRVKSLDENKILHDILEDELLQTKITDLNKNQLLEGKGADFNDLPKYVDDPFFKTIKAAKAYEAFKQKISPNHHKPIAVMDFYITGQFHETIKMKNDSNSFSLVSDSDIANDVQLKTGNEALGLSDESLDMIKPEIENKLIEKIEEKIFV